MRGWWREIAGLVFPAECAGCGRARTGLCEECRAAVCGAGVRKVRADPVPEGLPEVWAAAGYADEVRAVLLAHKERGVTGLARPLGEALAGAVRAVAPGGVMLLVPVPSARRAVAVRGHDAIRRITLVAARELRRDGIRARAAAVLRQGRAVADQSGLSARERLENLSGAVTGRPGSGRLLKAAPVVLVDDLMTTGASLVAAARAVEAVGGRVAGAAVVAGPRDETQGGRLGV
ncbi:ComF family protein [Actinacidiphila oryziradicis]|jgi:predicted amidophosphoribosyltransferase|uniref:ComF family protein n=1 Tax=Actinacidiphila oryziradicis TaxID=2571141 RepID=A0A4V5N0X5_9ACTN|nr:phosphoribosyltransferase family protein [Actinacidiphila oryziradicis]TKA13519.1 ComF family protein [Actinacidiphila oryziradicis]